MSVEQTMFGLSKQIKLPDAITEVLNGCDRMEQTMMNHTIQGDVTCSSQSNYTENSKSLLQRFIRTSDYLITGDIYSQMDLQVGW
jgi:hypothetical protein